jgi:Tfp pilus assembly protein PilN
MNITTLNIGAHSIKALSIHGTAISRHEAPLQPGDVKNGLILQPETVGRTIKSLFSSAKLPNGRVICAINGLPFSYRLLTVPVLERPALDEAVIRTAKKEMSISTDEMYLSWQAYPAENNEWQVLVTGITRRPVDNFIKALSIAGVRPGILELPHLALAGLSPCKDAVIADFEKDCSNIVMLVGGVPRGMQMAPALAPGASLQDQVGQVADKLARMVDFYNNTHPHQLIKEPVRVFVTGEMLEDEKTAGFFQLPPGYTVEYLPAVKKYLSGWPVRQYAVNTGLLDLPQSNNPCQLLNLESIIQSRRPRTNVAGMLKKAAVPVALVAGISLLAVSYLSRANGLEDITTLQADFNRAETELAQKQAAAADARVVQEKIDAITSGVTAIESGREEIFASRQYTSDITAIIASMPEGLTVNSLEVSGGSISLEGTAAATAPVIQYAHNLETAGGFYRAVINWIDKPRAIAQEQSQLSFRMEILRDADAAE